ncbi:MULTISPECIES: DEAD/DEAH box helicase [Marichromatium]|uniref:DEAD-box ATP-dependent RNA helicase RhpA n=1 Tax=Marichromatium gracile TaxID=1048 RepID=A0A4V2WA74_MARGR|nr:MULTISPECIES: DEAD/DEAH box helicase [Marichromatium]MBO8084458.1 DEAD/DEAH box helicase [Marichromatium sp.]MBK1708288.1 ATP-dependent RNA helicase RhlE [Marichromatium gracile]RNE90805.1 DEAD/DEAH box helicase [Marichromatium sp. AB31]RNE94423.1 DEAD/DEAH box helicase [Marichromatium sp. AB32]TCW38250.1 ATP-dependent RNA helicase RhlE [Marichromatium gracile]
MSFDSLGLRADLLRAVAGQGYARPTPIQEQAIPAVLAGHDLLAGAQTGTGKTAAFALPVLQLLAARKSNGGRRLPRALVLSPTRELAAQIGERFQAYGREVSLRSTVIFGGVGMQPQVDRLRRGVDILVATPGRLLDHAARRTLDLSAVEILVLDEADRMLDMGFIHDIRKVLALLPKQRQNLLFSATYSDEIRRLADGILHQPKLVEVARRNTAAETVEQGAHPVDKSRKRELLAHLFHREGWEQALVFTRTKAGANRLAEYLGREGIAAAAIHGNKSQSARTRALSEFKQGRVRALVATDIAARGIDIANLPQVVNFELPAVAEDYVHRIGRTGRAGAGGRALSLVSHDERKLLNGIQRLIKREIVLQPVAGFEPSAEAPASETLDHGRGGRHRRSGGRNGGRGNGGNAQRERSGRPASKSRSGQGAKRARLGQGGSTRA